MPCFHLLEDMVAQPADAIGQRSGLGSVQVLEAVTYANKDPYWQATADDSTSVLPTENVTVKTDGGRLTADLPAVSWSMIRLAVNQ